MSYVIYSSRAIEKKNKFPSCIGTLIPLAFTPQWSHQEFYSRKGFYAMSALVVCDHKRRITMLFSGYAGCAHDVRVFKESPLYTNPSRYFDDDEYVLADSAYTPSRTIVLVIKRPWKASFSTKQKQFNYMHAVTRVSVENCIGVLKGRFQSLRGYRSLIRNAQDVQRLNA